MTETWFRPNTDDSAEIGTLCPIGHRAIHIPRSYSAGGGVEIIFKNSIRINTSITDQYLCFELMDFYLRTSLCCIRILLVYRPPGLSTSLLQEEFSKLLELITADQ